MPTRAPTRRTPAPDAAAWSLSLRQAEQARHAGQLLMALAHYRQALAQAQQALQAQHPLRHEEALQALVTSSAALAELTEEAQSPALAARIRADLHRALHKLLCGQVVLRRSALWHCRVSHEALMRHVQDHGWSADIEAALRAGCMAMHCASVAGPPPSTH
ncbi:MAG: hypothetical protein C0443_11610 [Comamonadaceae bacterium]|nr:hypothetical protein [Comamonadaceae bacterium]